MDLSHHPRQAKFLTLPPQLLEDGQNKAKLNSLEEKENQLIEDIILKNTLKDLKRIEDVDKKQFQEQIKNLKNLLKKKSVTVECLRETRKKILNDRKNFLRNNTLNTELLAITDRVLISREKVLKPFWDSQSKELSKKLWLPTKTDYVASDLSSLNTISRNFLAQKSWFSTKHHTPLIKNSSRIFYQLQPFSLPSYTDSGLVKVKGEKKKKKKPKKKKNLKALKIRLILSKDQKQLLKEYFGVFRWYYNCAKNIFDLQVNKKGFFKKDGSVRWESVRDLVRKHRIVEHKNKEKRHSYVKDEKLNKLPVPKWLEKKGISVHNRIPRGAIKNYVSNYNSAYSNFINGNIKKFEIGYKTKKDKKQILYFEDSQIPKFIKKLNGVYKIGRKRIKLKDILEKTKIKNAIIHYDSRINRYTMIYPVDVDWKFNKNENQVAGKLPFISLDTGVRTFQTGYGGDHLLEIGTGDCKKLCDLLKKADKIKSIMDIFGWKTKRKKKFMKIYYKIRCLVNEIHWKTASYLTRMYHNIILPKFSISSMVKGKLPRSVKRMLYVYSYYKFTEKIKYKARINKCNLYIVGEEYTSKTCGNCGKLNQKLGGSKLFSCSHCKIKMDRDVNGARNILLKNYKMTNLRFK